MIYTTKPIAKRTGNPVAALFTLDECLAQLRESAGVADAYILSLADVARTACEERTERTLVHTPWVLMQDGFAGAIELPRPPIVSVQSVQYVDADGLTQTLDPGQYVLDSHSEPGFIVPAPGVDWPATADAINTVRVAYTAGYGTTGAAVPTPLKQWCLLMLTQLYEVRKQSGVTPEAPHNFADEFLHLYRVVGL